MRYYKKLYIGNNIGRETVEQLKCGIPADNVYALCVCEKTEGLLEILSTHELLKPHNLERDYAVIALLEGKGSAECAVVDLLCSWLEKHKDLSLLKDYYNNNSQQVM